ncbi:MAG: HD domain-containing protein [Nitrospirae bacterium]|nr:HD domain-containing protein [Nitrospirota bacterium]
MKDTNKKIRLVDLMICLSDAMDFIDPSVVDHHKRVAYIAHSMAAEMGLPLAQQKEIVLAGALHDIGAFSLAERRNTLAFEVLNPHRHAENGYALLKLFSPLSLVASMVRYHHVPWDDGSGREHKGQEVPLSSHMLHLSDRIAVLINRKKEILSQANRICRTIQANAGRLFSPELVDVFRTLSEKEYFWLDLASPSIQTILSQRLRTARIGVTSKDMLGFSQLFSRIIDFKSPFTATHSSGVAASAEFLAGKLGFARQECTAMRIAGYMHDLGKLAVPVEILDKPSQLNRREFNVVRHHTFYTYRILEPIAALQTINAWAAFHHERLDGSGYPFHLKEKDLPLGSQVMAVADVFTALTEDRPYRLGMKRPETLRVLDDMRKRSALNGQIVAVLGEHFDELDAIRMAAQADARTKYQTAAL